MVLASIDESIVMILWPTKDYASEVGHSPHPKLEVRQTDEFVLRGSEFASAGMAT